ncbi:ABC transporter substrate-binding protein [Lepagella muris]|jgi:iron complex transport system substrate-binding protein|uniref:Iron ABC transporter substrate-binding protein n=1 Tax=Lepagella muris TaxID=3032870 RepID=A0AC61RFX9_9BACT|nr:ABC transporter substrate-binding protein [Lepagella muris]TGY78265.1 iron ABC transporter substrate-binding protein [Lepagella muris]THG53781.1 iron ABC transporter substrate-binding protein [Bacteroidales bacterium]TKC66015.1 iron ABC transporter substrate-binding protein [Bacteroidales bacterium]
MKKAIHILCLAAAVMLTACGARNAAGANDAEASSATDSIATVIPKYAQGFHVKNSGDITLLDINDPENREAEKFHFALTDKDFIGEIPQGYKRINIPIESAICMTSLQLSNFLKLDIPEKVVGITSTRHLHNEKMNRQIKEGTTHKIGIEGNFDNEVIIAIDPDVIFVSPFKRGGYDAIRNVDIPLLPHLGYKELSPLGQAEWIKVVGLLTGNTAKANEIFSDIERRYLALKAMVDTVGVRPTVFSGEMRGGNWYAVGGKSFLAQLFRDAGGDYFLKDNTESGGITLDYETVYANASEADYWRIVNSFDGDFSYDALKKIDNRYTDFKAWKNKGVIYCNMNEVPFYERMPVEPEVVLADFIHVFHPDILPDHQPAYYHLLKK